MVSTPTFLEVVYRPISMYSADPSGPFRHTTIRISHFDDLWSLILMEFVTLMGLISIIIFSSQALAMKQASTGVRSQGVSERDFDEAGNVNIF